MFRQNAHIHERVGTDLSEYGDLSTFDQTDHRLLKEQDEQVAIDLVMGGESFLVGDGTLPPRLEDRERAPAMPPTAPSIRAPVRERAAIDRDAAAGLDVEVKSGVADGLSRLDAADQVARGAISDALSRLESLAGATQSTQESTARSGAVDATLSGERADALLRGQISEDSTFGIDGEAPSPYALPKLPGGFDSPGHRAANEVVDRPDGPMSPSDTRPREVADVMDSHLFGHENLNPPGTVAFGERAPAAGASPAEDFAPFGFPVLDQTSDRHGVSTPAAHVPAYARARPDHDRMSSAPLDLDEFLPPLDTPPTSRASSPAQLSSARSPVYSTPNVDPPTQDDARHDDDTVIHASDSRPSDHEAHPSSQGVGATSLPKRSFIARYGAPLLAMLLAAAAIGAKQFLMTPSAPAATPPPTHDNAGAPVDAALAGLLPPPNSAPVHDPVQPMDGRSAATPATDESPSAQDAALQAKVTELAARLTALESERDQLRTENQALKRKSSPARSKALTATPAASAPAAPPVPRKPQYTIQYLGSFREGDRLVAEVLIDGNLARVKRGDALAGNQRVTAISELSVTIDDVVYSP